MTMNLQRLLCALAVAVVIGSARADIQTGLVGHYHFDETNGTTAVDSAGSNPGTANADRVFTSSVSGISGQCADFTQGNDSIRYNSTFGITTGSYSVAFWVNVRTFDGKLIWNKYDNTDKTAFWISTQTNGTIRFCRNNYNAGNVGEVYTGVLSTGTWYHVAYIIDRASGTGTAYLDGKRVGSGNISTGGGSGSYASGMMLGDYLTFSNIFYDGLVDEFRIWNRTLSASEVFILANEFSPLNSGLIAYYPFNGDANDATGNGNTATLYNTAHYVDGESGQAVYLTGRLHTGTTGDYVLFPGLDLHTYPQFSVSLWVKHDGYAGSFDHGESYICFAGQNDIKCHIGFGGTPWATQYSGSDAGLTSVMGATEWGNWVHHTLIYSNGTLSAFKNGILVGSTNGVTIEPITQGGLGIHWWTPTGVSTRFVGAIDDVRIYNRALSTEDVFWLYDGEIPILNAPADLTATDGTVIDAIILNWSAVSNATSYSIWRADTNDSSSATLIESGQTSTNYSDPASPGITNWYWIQAVNSSVTGPLSETDSGWAARGVQFITEGNPERLGAPEPFGYGTNTLFEGQIITNHVISAINVSAGVRDRCLGYTGTGSAPSGSSNEVEFAVTEDSLLTWLWQREHELAVNPSEGGSVSTSGWFAADSAVTISAIPSNGWRFVSWQGDVPAEETMHSTMVLALDVPRTITPQFSSLSQDSDGDGLTDDDENFIYGTNPFSDDTDADGMPDKWEVDNGTNPRADDAAQDRDLDMVSNLDEFLHATSPANAYTHDGTNDYEWIFGATNNIKRNYYDRNDRLVGQQYSQGFSLAYQYDGNGNIIRKARLGIDNDSDGVLDIIEFVSGTSVTNSDDFTMDSDGDGWTDGQEVSAGSNPHDAGDIPSVAGSAGDVLQAIEWPFKPTRITMAAGNLNSIPGDEIVVSADGDVGDADSFIVLLTQDSSGWIRSDIPIGNAAVSSLTIGTVGNRPAAIYAGLRDYAMGGSVMEAVFDGSAWTCSTVFKSGQSSAEVIGVRSNLDLVASFRDPVSGVDGIYSLTHQGDSWNKELLDDLSASRSSGIIATTDLGASGSIGAPVRLLDQGGIQVLNESGSGQLDQTLLSFYPLDGHFFDLNERERHATGANLSYCEDRNGLVDSACRFNGTNAYAEIAAYAELKWNFSTDRYAVSFWFRSDESGRQQTLLCDTSSNLARSFRIYVGADNKIRADIYDLVHAYSFEPLQGGTVVTGQWYHVALSVQDSTASLYINGQMVRSRRLYCTSTKNSLPIEVGKFNNTEYFKGALDDLRFYGRALDDTEISTLSEHGSLPHGIIMPEPDGDLMVYPGQCFSDGSFGRSPVEQERSTNIVYHYVAAAGSNIAPYTNWQTAATSIQSAINVADDGAVVLVTNGSFSAITVDKPIVIRSVNGRDVTTINGRSKMENGAVLDGFTVTGGSIGGRPAQGGGLYIYSYAEIRNCTVRNNTAGGTYWDNAGTIYAEGGGIYCAGDCVISNSIIRDNAATITAYESDSQDAKGGGLYCSGIATLYNCQISNNTSYARCANDNAYSPDSRGGGMWVGTVRMRNCFVQGNRAEASATAEGENSDARGGGIYCAGGTVYDSTVKNNTVKSTANSDLNQDADGFGGGIYGSVAYSNCVIQGNMVEVRAEDSADGGGGGIYGSTSLGYDSVISDNNVNVYSSAKDAAVEVGGADNDVYRCQVINNHANAYGETRADADSGGVGGDAYYSTIMNNSILADTSIGYADADGGGVYSTADHCIVSGNKASADTSSTSGNLATANGGGVGGSAKDSLIYNNEVYAYGGSGSYARGGGLDGGGRNCTIINNRARGNKILEGGGVYLGTLYNSIIVSNEAGNYVGSVLYNCCTDPLPSDGISSGCMVANPSFVNPSSGNYHLSAGSPCIDGGTNLLSLSKDDLDKNIRITGAKVDIGCYEFGSTPYEAPFVPEPVSSGSEDVAQASARSVIYAAVVDNNQSSGTDAGDAFILTEYVTGTQAWNSFVSAPYYLSKSQSSLGYALASYPSEEQDRMLVGAPDGAVLVYAPTHSESNLSWSVLSEFYKGRRWHEFRPAVTLDLENSIIGIVSDENSPENCQVVLWDNELAASPRVITADVTSQSPPCAIVMTPTSGAQGAVAAAEFKLLDAEQNPCSVQMQYRVLGGESWFQCPLRSIDGVPYRGDRIIASTPAGANHMALWAAAEVLGADFTGYVEIRMQAEDVSGCGAWSSAVICEMNTAESGNLPTINITTPSHTIGYPSLNVTLIGIANSNVTGSISVLNTRNSWRGTVPAAESWETGSIPVEPGDNVIVVEATNSAGFAVSDSVTISRERYNTVPPVIVVTGVLPGENSGEILLRGTASQNVVGMMTYDQQTVGVSTSGVASSAWQSPALPFMSGENRINITASNEYSLSSTINFLWDTSADDDRDGEDNYSEMISGTDFSDGQSRLCVFLDGGEPGWILSWNAVSGRVYSVYWTTNLLNGFQCLESNIPWTRASFTNSASMPSGFYKLDVQLAE